MPRLLEDKVIVVTGASASVGKGIALEAARQSAKLVVNDLGVAIDGTGGSSAPAQLTVDEIRAAGGVACASNESVTDWKSAQRIVQQVLDLYGRVDAVVNNAGNLRDAIFHKMSEEDFNAVLSVHLKGSFNMSRAASPHFKSEGSSAFVHMTSTSGLIGTFGQANYSAAKNAPFACALMTDAARSVTGQIFGVRNNEIFLFSQPSPIRTAHAGGGWTVQACLDVALPMMQPSFHPLELQGRVFLGSRLTTLAAEK